uniref:Arrestin C-terminal-like domain-containing protein n=1 Tax=Caenorhabditis japonica TaxID=281687 RepID=A0A8R1I0M4_CAEJA
MKVDYFEVTLNKGIDEPYLGGDPIRGIIEMVCSKQVRITGLVVRLTGVAETGWRSRQDDLTYESRQTFMDERIDLTTTIADHCNENFELQEGKHSVEFEGRIPLDVLSSVERENHGNVRYTCTALMAIPEDGDTEVVSEKTFKVYSLLNLDAPYLHEKSYVVEKEEIIGCCGKRKGAMIATMQIDEIGVMPGLTSKISLTVENNSVKRKKWLRKKENHECVLLSLCQQLDFIAGNRSDHTLIERKSITIAIESHGTCKTKAGTGPQTKEIEFSVPANLPPTSIHANRLVTISYFFKFDLEHFDLILPVIVGSTKSTL